MDVKQFFELFFSSSDHWFASSLRVPFKPELLDTPSSCALVAARDLFDVQPAAGAKTRDDADGKLLLTEGLRRAVIRLSPVFFSGYRGVPFWTSRPSVPVRRVSFPKVAFYSHSTAMIASVIYSLL